jgi:hypothetical protein
LPHHANLIPLQVNLMRVKLCIRLAILAATCAAHHFALGSDRLCAHATWATCSGLIKDAIDKDDGSEPKRLLGLAMEWNESCDARYEQLRKVGRAESSVPDSEKVYEAVRDKLNPESIAKDKALDLLFRTWLPRVAEVIEWASGPFVSGLRAFFTSSSIASDYDELRICNVDIQTALNKKLMPYMEPDWKSKLNTAVQQAGQELRTP